MTNKELDLCIEQIAAGDRTALRQLYDEMKGPVFTFALSLTGNKQSAEDVEQETFLKVMNSAANYRKGTKPKAWIFGIARHCCVDCLKGTAKTQPLEETALNIPSTENVFETVSNAELALGALNSLDETERMIVSLYLYTGLKQTEIAQTLNLSYLSVRSKYAYALKKLRLYFQKKGVDYYE